MDVFKIIMTCHDVNPTIPPYLDEVEQEFYSKKDAQIAIAKCAADELESLNGGDAQGEFLISFEREGHEAVVEFWEGHREDNFEEMSRDMRPVTVYDILQVTGEGAVFRHSRSLRIIQEHMQGTYEACMAFCVKSGWQIVDQHGVIWDLELRDNRRQRNPIYPAAMKHTTGCQGTQLPQKITCVMCGSEIVWEHPNISGLFLSSSDYIGGDICRSCMEEHCAQTNCLNCELGTWPNCPFQWLKEQEDNKDA